MLLVVYSVVYIVFGVRWFICCHCLLCFCGLAVPDCDFRFTYFGLWLVDLGLCVGIFGCFRLVWLEFCCC